jgi:hypothetical protein
MTPILLIPTDFLAQIEMESPQYKKIIFLVVKERPKEAPFRT